MSRSAKKTNLIVQRVPAPFTDSGAVVSAESHTPVDVLRRMLQVSPEFFERLHRDDDTGGSNEMRSLLQKDAHCYDSRVRLIGAGSPT